MQRAGVELRERTAFTGLRLDGGRVVGVETSAGPIATERVLLTGGPTLRAVGRVGRCPDPGRRRLGTPWRSRSPIRRSTSRASRWASSSGRGLYWRLEEGGLLFGWSDPDEQPGEARSIDMDALALIRERLAELVPIDA